MFNIIIEHSQYISLFFSSESLYDKSVIAGKEEKGARLTNTFSCLENSIPICIQRQGFDDVIGADIIHPHNLCKLLLFMTDDFRLDAHLQLIAIHQILFYLLFLFNLEPHT